jgi:type II secretory pathway pseudopilin PulG
MKATPHGFSLIMVLVALAIMCLLVLALLSGASHGLRYAQGDANLARETMLADTAAALVIGQIQQATIATNQAWISQPGLIRTYAATNTTRAPIACYKLYSAPQMIDKAGTFRS